MGKTWYGKKSTEAKSIIFDQIKNSQSCHQSGNYSTTVFDRPTLFSFWKRKLKYVKMTFQGQIDFWFLPCGDIHTLPVVKACSLV